MKVGVRLTTVQGKVTATPQLPQSRQVPWGLSLPRPLSSLLQHRGMGSLTPRPLSTHRR